MYACVSQMGSFLQTSPTEILCAFLISATRSMRLIHPNLLHPITLTISGERVQTVKLPVTRWVYMWTSPWHIYTSSQAWNWYGVKLRNKTVSKARIMTSNETRKRLSTVCKRKKCSWHIWKHCLYNRLDEPRKITILSRLQVTRQRFELGMYRIQA
jgi:hypothetical protein